MSSFQQHPSHINRYISFDTDNIGDGSTSIFIGLRILNYESEGATILAVLEQKLLEKVRSGCRTIFFPLK